MDADARDEAEAEAIAVGGQQMASRCPSSSPSSSSSSPSSSRPKKNLSETDVEEEDDGVAALLRLSPAEPLRVSSGGHGPGRACAGGLEWNGVCRKREDNQPVQFHLGFVVPGDRESKIAGLAFGIVLSGHEGDDYPNTCALLGRNLTARRPAANAAAADTADLGADACRSVPPGAVRRPTAFFSGIPAGVFCGLSAGGGPGGASLPPRHGLPPVLANGKKRETRSRTEPHMYVAKCPLFGLCPSWARKAFFTLRETRICDHSEGVFFLFPACVRACVHAQGKKPPPPFLLLRMYL